MQLNIIKLNQELSALRIFKDESIKLKLTHEEEKAKLEEKIKALEKQIEDMKAEHKEAKAEAKKEEAAIVIAVEETVNKKVIQNLASIGVQEGTVKDVVAPVATTEPTELYKQFETMTGKEKIEFFKKNERAILNGMKMTHYTNNPLAKIGINQRF